MPQLPFGRRACLIIVAVWLVGGLAIGLFVGWMMWPVQVTNVDMTDLASSYQDDYIVLTASSYAVDQDLDKAQTRLATLKDPNIQDRVIKLAKSLAAAQNKTEAGYVAVLAMALGSQDSALALLIPTATPTATFTPISTRVAPSPTSSPTATPSLVPTATITPTRTATPRPRATNTPLPPTAAPILGTVWQPDRNAWPSGTNYQPANVAPGQKFWHLAKAIFCDLNDKHDYCKDMPGGGQQEGIWVMLIGPTGAREEAGLIVTKPDGSKATKPDGIDQKSPDDMCRCNYSFFANGWPIRVDGAPSDMVSGLAMNQNYHVRFFITFQLLTR